MSALLRASQLAGPLLGGAAGAVGGGITAAVSHDGEGHGRLWKVVTDGALNGAMAGMSGALGVRGPLAVVIGFGAGAMEGNSPDGVAD